eukprot:TRINITY_DN2616_c0_g1_i1.p1 TRINITY_DN2616_c0_g1~~TRINITY_DN2616_c0_g1_i1.p1  ORF type:complete len:264 (-),score=50.62 TRINITY_DN2616_c0_g1_i1:61-807(-)
MAVQPQLARSRASSRVLTALLGVLVAAALTLAFPWCTTSFTGVQPQLQTRDDSALAMRSRSRRQRKYNFAKKNHPKFSADRYYKGVTLVPNEFLSMTQIPDPTLDHYSFTLKLNFPEGEDDVVTEDEVREYFTTDDYAPEAVIVGHKLPHEEIKHAYVHFSCNEHAKQARKEKQGGSIGKASEVKLVFTDEKKWIRLRDGVSLRGNGNPWNQFRPFWMKAYGQQQYPGWGLNEKMEPFGARRHPVYPE